MSEKRINNTIFLMYEATENYCKKHNLSPEDFLALDEKYEILKIPTGMNKKKMHQKKK